MAAEGPKDTVRRWIAARNANDLEAAVACWAEDQQEEIRRAFAAFTAAFADIRIEPEVLLAERDRVALRWTFRGTHRGEYLGIPATGAAVTWTGTDLYTVAGDRLADLVREADRLSLLERFGVGPPTPARGT